MVLIRSRPCCLPYGQKLVSLPMKTLILLLSLLLPESIAMAEPNDDILIMAHRGGKGLWPENTIEGYRRALEAEVDVLEIDVWRTKDNVVVVNHDETVDRTTNGKGEVRSFTLQELQALDSGYRWSVDGTYPYRGAGYHIPTLDEVLAAFPEARFNIDLKENSDALISSVAEIITKHGAENRVLVASFHQSALRAFRQLSPNVPTSACVNEIIRFLILSKLRLTFTYKPNFAAFQVPPRAQFFDIVSPSFVAAAHRAGVEVHPWTINDPNEMKRLIAMGVDGIITDYPDRLSKVLSSE